MKRAIGSDTPNVCKRLGKGGLGLSLHLGEVSVAAIIPTILLLRYHNFKIEQYPVGNLDLRFLKMSNFLLYSLSCWLRQQLATQLSGKPAVHYKGQF